MLTRTAAVEYAGNNIRVNCICPGYIATPMSDRGIAGRDPSKWGGNPPYRPPSFIERRGTAEEVGKVALFLASDEATFITGESIIIDGGQTVAQ